MEKTRTTVENPWDNLKKLKGRALKAAQNKLTEQGFRLHLTGTESNMGELIMLIAKLTSKKIEFKLIDNASEIEVWIKPSDSERVAGETREEIAPLFDPDDQRRYK